MQTALAVFCVVTVLFLVSRDLFLPHVRDVEVWFGFELRGVAARLTAPLHWAIFAFGAWAAWRARPWALPAAAGYAFLVAASHLVWSEASPNGGGWPTGLLHATALSLPGFVLLAAHRRSRLRRAG
jgi:hypothetical protein